MNLKHFKFSFTVSSATRLLSALFAIIFLYTIYDLSVSARRRDNVGLAKAGVEKANHKEAGIDISSDIKRQPLSYYTQDTQRRELFKRGSGEEVQREATEGPQDAKLEEAAKALSLKGIIEGDVPQAVIEDTKTQKTYFVRQGEKISGFTVAEILSNKVVLKSGEKTVDLVL